MCISIKYNFHYCERSLQEYGLFSLPYIFLITLLNLCIYIYI